MRLKKLFEDRKNVMKLLGSLTAATGFGLWNVKPAKPVKPHQETLSECWDRLHGVDNQRRGGFRR